MKKKRLIKRVPFTSDRGTGEIDVELFYETGELNYLTGEKRLRGYYISAVPWYDDVVGGRSALAFSGVADMVEECKRFSAKVFNRVVVSEEKIAKMVGTALAKNRLVVA